MFLDGEDITRAIDCPYGRKIRQEQEQRQTEAKLWRLVWAFAVALAVVGCGGVIACLTIIRSLL